MLTRHNAVNVVCNNNTMIVVFPRQQNNKSVKNDTTTTVPSRDMYKCVSDDIPLHVQHPLGKQQLHAFVDESTYH